MNDHSMTLDEVEIYLADAQDFDVHFVAAYGNYALDGRPILEWLDGYPTGGRQVAGWLLSESGPDAREHFWGCSRRTQLDVVAMLARVKLDEWRRDSRSSL